MNIGFFSDGYTPQLNGVATNVEAVAAALERQGHSVSIFAPRMGDYVDCRTRVYRLPSLLAIKDPPLWCTLPPTPRALDRIACLPLDVVHIHSPFGMGFIGWEIARRRGIPIVSTYHTLLPAQVHHVCLFGWQLISPRVAAWYSAWTCGMCDCIVAPSEKIRACLQVMGVRRPIHLIRNGIDLDRFGHGSPGYLRHRFGLDATDRILLSVGRLTEDKNFSFLVDVLPRVTAQNPNTRLVLVGQGPMAEQLQERANRLGVGRNLVLTGPLQPGEMPQVYADADVFVNASTSETFSIVTLEAIVSGLPLVVAHDEALQVMVQDSRNGWIVPSDADSFACAVLRILASPELSESMRAASRTLGGKFSVQAQAESLAKLYTTLAEERRWRRRQSDLPRPSFQRRKV